MRGQTMDEYEGINPEIASVSPWFRDLMGASDELMNVGISPATAAVIVASVPITLRLLRMGNEVLSAWVDDTREKNRLARKREEADLDHEIDAKRKEAGLKTP